MELLASCAQLEKIRLTYVAVVLFVRSDCVPRLWPQDSVNGSVIVTSALQPALQLRDSGLAGIAILTIARWTIAVAVSISAVPRPAIARPAIAITIAVVRIAVTVVSVWIGVPAPPRAPAPAPTPPPWEAEATDEDDTIVDMIRVAVPMPVATMQVAAMPVAHRSATGELTATEARATTTEARATATEATAAPTEATATVWSSCENWTSQHRRKKATQEK
jgi:hypothetical protein